MSVDIILKDIEWDGVNKIRVPLEGGGTQDFSIGGGSANLQTKSKTYTPTSSQQTDAVLPDTGYDGMDRVNVTVNAVSSGSVVSEISYTDTEPSVTVDNSGIVHISGGYSATTNPVSSSGWIDSSATTEIEIGVMGTYQLPTQGATTITPSTSQQTAVTSGKYTTGNVVVSAVPSMTLPASTSSSPTGTRRANLYPSTSQQYLNIPSGYNSTARYYQIIGMDLAPLNVTQNGTYNASDVDITGFNTVTVNVPTGGSTLQTKSATYTPTTSQQTDTITPDSGYDGLDEVDITINAVPTGSVTMPSSISTSGGTTHYTTHNTLVITASATATPNVTTAGYISAGTSGATTLLVNTNIPTISTATITPATTDQTIPDNRYILGTQTIKAVTTNNIIASNIKSGVTVEVGDTDDPDRILSVTGTYSGGIGTLLATKSLGTISTNSTTATDTGQTVSVSGINGYDLLIVETSVDTKTNGRHASTMQCIWLTASSTIGTKNGSAIATATMNDKLSSSGTVTSRSTTTKYGIYVNSVSISNGSATLTMYERYNSTQTGTINGSYTTRVYGVNLYDLIGG